MTITINRWRSDGSADAATFSITPNSLEVGGAASAPRVCYCGKATRRERERGLKGMAPVTRAEVTGRKEGSAGQDNPRAGVQRQGTFLNDHPTVKPLALMRWLVRLTKMPVPGIVLDPFMGSGTTGIAAVLEGRPFIGAEIGDRSYEIARRRIAWAERKMNQPRLFTGG